MRRIIRTANAIESLNSYCELNQQGIVFSRYYYLISCGNGCLMQGIFTYGNYLLRRPAILWSLCI